MENLLLESRDLKVEKLINDVNHKFNIFSISNTLFPKNKIDDSDLHQFFNIISERISFILSTPIGVFNRVINNKFESNSYSVSPIESSSLLQLANNILLSLKEEEVIGFYDLTYDKSNYRVRLYTFSDELRLRAIKRDNRLDQILDEIKKPLS